MYQKKVISKNVTEKCTFFTFSHVRQTCFAYNFFVVHFFTTFSTDSKSAWNFAFFDNFFDFFQKKILKVILVLFSNLEAKRARNGLKKSKNVFSKCVLDFNLHPSKGLYSLFSKKKSNSLYPTIHAKFFHFLIPYLVMSLSVDLTFPVSDIFCL